MKGAFEIENIHLYKTATVGRYTNYPLIFIAKDKDGILYMCHLMYEKDRERQLRYIGIVLTKELSERIDDGMNIPDAFVEAKEIYDVQASQIEPIRAWPTENIYEIKERISKTIIKKSNHE